MLGCFVPYGQRCWLGTCTKMQCSSQAQRPVVISFADNALSLQMCKSSSLDKHSILANCFFLTRCGLAVFNGPLIFFSCFYSPSLFLPCLVSFQPPPCTCPYLLPICWAALLLATKPCCTALLHPGEDKRLSSAAFPEYSIRAMGGTTAEGSPD